jgi:transcriptional regulator with XRE-family HTH domain
MFSLRIVSFLGALILLTILVSMERINKIKEVLVSKGKTQVWLSSEIGKSINTVSAFCSNRRQPSLTELKRIAEILDVDIRELLVPTK